MQLRTLTDPLAVKEKSKAATWAFFLLQVLAGSVFLGLMSQVAIPLPYTPVPLTLQTLAVSLLAISLGPKKAPLAVIAYLIQATIGLPVLAGGVCKPLWMMGPHAGYLLSYILSSYLVAKVLSFQKKPSFGASWLTLSLNEATVLTLGSIWLMFFVGVEKGFFFGFVPFILGAFVKISFAATLLKSVRWAQQKLV